MRFVLMLVFMLGLALPCGGQETRSNYQIWFDSFLTRFKDCGFATDERDKVDLTDLLRFKPAGTTGQFYNDWFDKGFCWFLLASQNTFTPEATEKMEFMLQAMPTLDGSELHFGRYFQFVLKQLEGFLPTLDGDEPLQMTFLLKAKPSSGKKDYEPWLEIINRWKADFGPDYSQDEQEVLAFLEKIRPSGTSSEDTLLPVPRESLLRIKYFLQDNKPASAMAEIDKMLQGSD